MNNDKNKNTFEFFNLMWDGPSEEELKSTAQNNEADLSIESTHSNSIISTGSKQKITKNTTVESSDFSDFTEDELELFNDGVHQILKNLIPENKYRTLFFNKFFLISISNDIVTFSISTITLKTMIEKQYQHYIQDAVEEALGQSYNIQIVINNNSTATNFNKNNILHSISKEKQNPYKTNNLTKNTQKPSFSIFPSEKEKEAVINSSLNRPNYTTFSNKNNELLTNTGIPIDPNKTFENFINGSSNNFARAAAISVANAPSRSGTDAKSLYIHGDSGLGKTHLLHAIANRVNETNPDYVVFFISATDFISEYVSATQNNRVDDFMHKYTREVNILMIDDIHVLSNREGTQNALFHIFNKLTETNRQLVFTSDKKPEDIVGMPKRLTSRFSSGLIANIIYPDFEMRASILKLLANKKDIFIPDAAIELMASAKTENIRELEGFIQKIAYVSEIDKCPIDVNLIKKFLNLEQTVVKKITIELITKVVAQQNKLLVPDIRSDKRTKPLTEARHIAIYLTKQYTNLTLEEIGHYFGGRNHSTILSSINKIKKSLKSDPLLQDTIDQIIKKIR